ncbi:hypothetical protein L210DRAFT_3511557 [Boletus edulis BED1]|uniref:Uncharacterized protein n=1 Tax=Boletus edulis BED1 TaxID=1328754 RepID=A0AAD4G5K5_BOLED|nr:hypothetical protein L210DRAFT_3511557 [Boletus edulis BED1]
MARFEPKRLLARKWWTSSVGLLRASTCSGTMMGSHRESRGYGSIDALVGARCCQLATMATRLIGLELCPSNSRRKPQIIRRIVRHAPEWDSQPLVPDGPSSRQLDYGLPTI